MKARYSGLEGKEYLKEAFTQYARYQESDGLVGRKLRVENVVFEGVNIREALREASTPYRMLALKDAYFENVTFINCDFYEIRFAKSRFENVKFKSSDVEDARFVDCVLDGVDVIETSLKSTAFINCRLGITKVTRCKMPVGGFNNCTFEKASLYRNDFSHSEFVSCVFTDTDITKNDMYSATLSHPHFIGDCQFQSNNLIRILVQRDVILQLSNFGTYNGPVYYFASSGIVFAGCWSGTIDEFETKYEKVFGDPNDRKLLKDRNAAEYQLQQFNLITTTLRNAELQFQKLEDPDAKPKPNPDYNGRWDS